jgi:hypothetical protein
MQRQLPPPPLLLLLPLSPLPHRQQGGQQLGRSMWWQNLQLLHGRARRSFIATSHQQRQLA